MATVMHDTISGDYDLARGLRFYDTTGGLAERSQKLWTIIGASDLDIAREYWRQNSRAMSSSDEPMRVHSLCDRSARPPVVS